MMTIDSSDDMLRLGERMAGFLRGGDVIELIGDVGAGKTTLVRGIAKGMAIEESVQSPSFTISRLYDTPGGKRLAHYDFYRLNDAGIMAGELAENEHDGDTVTIIEWAGAVESVLPRDRLTVTIRATGDDAREVSLGADGQRSAELKERLI